MVNLLENLKKFDKFGNEIRSILKLRNEFVQICSQELHYNEKKLVWSSVNAPSLIMSLILSYEFESFQKKRIYANCLVDLCHLFFALKDRVRDRQVTVQNEIEKYEKTAEILRCCFKKILSSAYSEGLITENIKNFFVPFLDNLTRYANRVVYLKEEGVKVENLVDNILNENRSHIFTPKDIFNLHKTQFGNFFRGMGYFLFKFYDLNLKNNRAYFDLFYNIGMLAQLVDDLRDLFWEDIEIEQPNIVIALLVHETWNSEGEKFTRLLKDRNNLKYNLIYKFEKSLNKMRWGEITLYNFYNQYFPKTYRFIDQIIQNYKNKIGFSLKELNMSRVTAEDIIEIYGIIIPLLKKLISKKAFKQV